MPMLSAYSEKPLKKHYQSNLVIPSEVEGPCVFGDSKRRRSTQYLKGMAFRPSKSAQKSNAASAAEVRSRCCNHSQHCKCRRSIPIGKLDSRGIQSCPGTIRAQTEG